MPLHTDLPCSECPTDDAIVCQKNADGTKIQRWFECRDCSYNSRSATIYGLER